MIFQQVSSVAAQTKKKKQSLKKVPMNNIFTNDQLQKPTIHANSHYLYTPTQYLISNFLTTKKTIQDNLITTLKSITDIRNNPQITTNQLREQLKSKKKQLQGIKRKLNKSCQQQTQVYDIMKKRIHRHQPIFIEKGKNNISNQNNLIITNTTNAISTNQQQQQSTILTKQPTIEQPQKDDLFHTDRLFELQMNKQIVYFMVDESVKKEQQLNRQQKLKQQLQLRQQLQQQENNNNSKAQERKQENQQQQNKNGEEQQQKPKQQQHQARLSSANNQNREQNRMYQSLPFTFIEQIQSQHQHLQINIDEDIFDLQRFFTMQDDDQMNMSMMNFQNRYGIQNRHFQRNKQALSKNINNKIKKQYDKDKIVDLQFTRRDLFKQEKFVKCMEKEQRKLLQSQKMDVEVNESFDKNLSQHNSNRKKIFFQSPFQGELELQCMLYRKQQQISQDILSNDLQSITLFLYQNTHMINKNQSHLEFWLTLCKAVELIKTKIQLKEMHALQIIRNMIARLKSQLQNWQKTQLEKVTCMLLLPQQNIDIKPYLQKIQESFKNVFQQIYKLPDFSRFLHTIYTGALILKTPTCIEKDKENPLICPLCNPLAQKVFTNIPLLTRNQSSLICRINGSVMDHENYPIMLPSFQIYSLKGLEDTKKTIKNNTGKIVQEYYCKFTETWYNKQLAKKVYLA